MTSQLPIAEPMTSRKRKVHKKSRQGCGNCKLRRVKCDENKPQCKKCMDFGVSCSYDPKSSTLELSTSGELSIDFSVKPLPQMVQSITFGMINPLVGLPTRPWVGRIDYQLGEQDMALLHKFQMRTSCTVGTELSSCLYQTEIFKLACSHSFLMHIVLAMTLMHDRHISPSPDRKPSPAESYHCYQGTALFNSALSQPIQPSERDALWGAAALLGAIAFSWVEARTPDEAWPLKASSPADLDWLKLTDGKREVYKITNPARLDSVFHTLFKPTGDFLPCDPRGTDLKNIPDEFIKLYELDHPSSGTQTANNPYHAAVCTLANLFNLECNRSTILEFLSFVTHMCTDLKQLLEAKDPRALLLLAHWYAKLCNYQQWWIWRRAVLECQAICIYLERYRGQHDIAIRGLLRWPKIICSGLVAG
ncbi:hypothetical protein AJ80_05794 [Polytolypa hystricis UAMH7299]|uniref:Zn(2)-C6 fungal-type domain-containing protein n=1 Tax=Polytolypa hystricis (strain UAMH7299) TaxID=1447883 RepID=A0A2B7Y0E0_POLH7|nr:hypothetical protein AJ80_05794 [Polytolypa hystricis UAMH7299]